MMQSALLDEVASYYSKKLLQHGQCPQGVDWNGVEGQFLRFEQLARIIEKSDFSINDLGCGYGAFYDFLQSRFQHIRYTGFDVAGAMIKAASERYHDQKQCRFLVADKPDVIADYSIASGIFNVKLSRAEDEWQQYIEVTLELLNQSSQQGFAFNCLTSYSDRDRMHDYLYYANPCYLFDLCKRRFSKNVALLHDYGLYEFTILVRK